MSNEWKISEDIKEILGTGGFSVERIEEMLRGDDEEVKEWLKEEIEFLEKLRSAGLLNTPKEAENIKEALSKYDDMLIENTEFVYHIAEMREEKKQLQFSLTQERERAKELAAKLDECQKNHQKWFDEYEPRLEKLKAENGRLRYHLWLKHNPEHFGILYGDDGEMQCSACGLDFKRSTIEQIDKTFDEQDWKRYREALKPEASDETGS